MRLSFKATYDQSEADSVRLCAQTLSKFVSNNIVQAVCCTVPYQYCVCVVQLCTVSYLKVW